MEANINLPETRHQAVLAAQGRRPFDLLITGSRIADMITGQLRSADIGLCGPLIASVHPRGSRNDTGKIIRAEGCIVSPGLIDTHLHIESSLITPRAYARAVLPRGVTTIVWDPHELANVCGIEGVRWAARSSEVTHLRTLVLAPSCVPSAPGLESCGADFGPEAVREMLSWKEIFGLAEVMNMNGVIGRDPRMARIVQAGIESGKLVCGHGRGLTGKELNAYAAAGIESDHEIISAKDLHDKILAGFTIELRGSHDHLLPEFVELLNRFETLPTTVTLCTDDVLPDDLEEHGGLDDVVRRLVRYGLPPLWALEAATRNAALRLGRPDLGVIAPGRRADLAVFADLESLVAKRVIVDGVLLEDTEDLQEESTLSPGTKLNSPSLPDPVTADAFRVPHEAGDVDVATIDEPRFTKWGHARTTACHGHVVPPAGSTIMAVLNRFRPHAQPRIAYVRGWGTWQGAFCTTISHDSHNLTVFGGNEADMAVAANHTIANGGGMTVAADGKVIASLSLPVAGLISDAPLREVSRSFTRIREAMDGLVDWKPPYRVFRACFGASLACNAGPHLTDLGIVDAGTREILRSPVLNGNRGQMLRRRPCRGS